jgi:hypothetical protein
LAHEALPSLMRKVLAHALEAASREAVPGTHATPDQGRVTRTIVPSRS